MTEENAELIKALEALNKTLGTNTNSTKDSSKLLRKTSEDNKRLDEQFKKLNKNLESLIRKQTTSTSKTQASGNSSQGMNQLSSSVSSLTSTFNSLNRSAQQLHKTLGSLGSNNRNLTSPQNRIADSTQKPKDNSESSINKLIKQKLTEYSAVNPMSGKGGGGRVGDYSKLAGLAVADSLKLLVSPLKMVGGLFGKLLGPLGLIISLFGKVATATIDYVQNSLDAFDEISKFGGHIGMTSNEVGKLANAAGYTSENFSKWAGVLAKNSRTLLHMNMPMSDAIRKFSDIANVGDTLKRQFARLGLAFEDQAEAFMEFADATIMRGGIISNDEKIRKKQMTEYFVQQTAINSMLGITAEQMKQEREKMLLEEEWASFLYRIPKELGEKLTTQMELVSKVSPRLATALKENLAKGTIQTAESGSLVAAGVDPSKLAKELKKGDYDATLNMMRNLFKFTNKQAATMFGSNEQGQSPGATTENLKGFNFDVKGQEFLRIAGTKSYKEIEEMVNKKMLLGDDAAKELQTTLAASKLDLGKALDNLTSIIADKAVPTLSNVGNVFVKWIKKLPGIFGGDSNMDNPFASESEKRDDIMAKLEKIDNKIYLAKRLPDVNKKEINQLQVERMELQKKLLGPASTQKENESPAETARLANVKPFEGDQKEFYNKMHATLVGEAKKAGLANPDVIAKLGTAQSALETGHGKRLAGGNNYFGIKSDSKNRGPEVSTQEWDPKTNKMITIKDSFRKYKSMEESAADYIKFLMENPRYKQVLASATTSEALKNIGKSGYATSPTYTSALQGINAQGEKTLGLSEGLPQGKVGGIFDGPNSGYPVMMHGREAIVPLSGNPASQMDLPDLAAMLEQKKAPPTSTNIESSTTFARGDIKVLVSKLDDLLNELSNSTRIQEKMLKTQVG